MIPRLLTVFRKRRFLDVRRESRDSLAQFEAEIVEVGFRRRVGTEFLDDGSKVGQRADRRQSGGMCWSNEPA
jgi:hypothetical protein